MSLLFKFETPAALILVSAMAISPAALAQQGHGEPESPHVDEESQHDGEEAHHAGTDMHHRNFIAGFVGITGEERRDQSPTLGIDYGRRISDRFGIGVGVERVLGDLDMTVGAVSFVYYSGRWKWFAGPGVEKKDGHDSEWLARVGLEYAFHVGGLELAPKFMVDYVDGHTVIVGGLSIGKGF